MTTASKWFWGISAAALAGAGYYFWKTKNRAYTSPTGNVNVGGVDKPVSSIDTLRGGGSPTHTVNGEPVNNTRPIDGPPAALPPPAVTYIQGDPRHVFGGTDGVFDNWSEVDEAGNTVTWRVNHGDDSRKIIWSTYQVHIPANRPTSSPTTGPFVPQPTNSPAVSNPTPVLPPPNKGDPRHVYDGRSGAFDQWHLIDEVGNRNDWETTAGDDSRSIIWSTYKVTPAAPGVFF